MLGKFEKTSYVVYIIGLKEVLDFYSQDSIDCLVTGHLIDYSASMNHILVFAQ